jgi:Leucine-rich repeat (LRR) protein
MTHIDDFGFLEPHAKTLVELTLFADKTMLDPARLPRLPALRSLELGIRGLADIGFLDELPRLRRVFLTYCDGVTDFSALYRQTELTYLWLVAATRLRSLSQLPPLGALHSLGLTRSHIAEGLDEICEASPGLKNLYVNNCDWVRSLRPLTGLPLVELLLSACPHATDFDAIASLTALDTLGLSGTRIRDLTPLRPLTRLRRLYLQYCADITDLQPLADLPNLRVLYLHGAAPGLDLAPLAANRRIEVYISPRQSVRGLEKFKGRLKVTGP